MSRRNLATIDVAAVRHNLNEVRRIAPHARVLAMVKANAYGHGIVPVARALAEADALGVACLEEALTLRQAGITTPIVMMAGFFEASELHLIAENAISIVIQNEWQVSVFESTRLATAVDVWIKVDTGMHRLGFPTEDFQKILCRLQATTQVRRVGLMSHFSDADDMQSEKTCEQLHLLQNVMRNFKGLVSIANSAGVLAWPHSHLNWVRPGIMLYGISPFKTSVGAECHLIPVMRLRSRIIAIHDCVPGDTVGYGSQYRCEKPQRIAIVCMGYGDGYPWCAPTGTPVLVHGVECPLVGRVSMDMLAIELKTAASVQDDVVLWGPELPVECIARAVGTIPYELITKLTARVRFEIVNADMYEEAK